MVPTDEWPNNRATDGQQKTFHNLNIESLIMNSQLFDLRSIAASAILFFLLFVFLLDQLLKTSLALDSPRSAFPG